MAEEVEITNVGGSDGVASEATLAALVSALQRMGGAGSDSGAKAAQKAQKLYTKTQQDGVLITRKNTQAELEKTKVLKEATGAVSNFSRTISGAAVGAIGDVLGSFVNFGEQLAFGGNRISNFTSSIPLIGQFLGPLSGMIDNSIDSFREVSQVGATFGEGLAGLRRAAADSAIPFDDFTDIVRENSVILQQFGGDVASGASSFGAMAKELRDGPGRELMNMGFTSMELNEVLLDYAELQTRQFRQNRTQGRVTAANAAAFAENLRELSAVTGKSREEIMKSMKAQQGDVRIGAVMANMTAEAAEKFSANIGAVSATSQGLANALIDYEDGIPTDETTKRLMAFSKTFATQGKNIENMDPTQLEAFMIQVNKELAASSQSFNKALQNVMDKTPGLADAFQIITDTNMLANETAEQKLAREKREEEQRKKQSGLMDFEETINQARSALQLAFIDSGIFKLTEDGVSEFATAIKDFTESPEFKDSLKALTSIIKDMIERFKTFFTDIGKFNLKTALFGGKAGDVIGQDEQGNDITLQEDVKGLFGDIFAGAAESAGTIGTFVADGIKSVIGGLFDGFEITWDDVFVGGLAVVATAIAAPIVGLPVLITAAITAVVGKDKLIELFTATWDTIKGFFSFGTGEDAASYSIGNLASAAWETVTGWFGFTGEEATYGISNLASAAWETVTGWFTMDSEGNYSILDIANNVWTSVTGWFSLADTKFSITEDLTKLWTTVTGWFGFGEGEATYAISTLINEAWTKITGFFDFGEEGFSISALTTEAWETVTGFFTLGEDTLGFSISTLATTAWETVKGFFRFGEDTSAFSISGLLTTAWETVTGFFSFDGIEIPSVSSMFQGIIDTVKGFFDFDFEMPNFKQYLPKWLGGEGKSLLDGSDTELEMPTAEVNPTTLDATPAVEGANSLMDAQSAMASFSNIEGLQSNLDILKSGLDTDSVRSYTESMEKLVEVLGELNDELAKDNKFGIGKGENAGSVLSKMDSIGGGSNEELNNTLKLVLAELQLQTPKQAAIARNTKNGNSTDISRSMPSG